MAYRGRVFIFSYPSKFSNEQRTPKLACFSLRNRCKLFIFPKLPAFTSIGTILQTYLQAKINKIQTCFGCKINFYQTSTCSVALKEMEDNGFPLNA